MEITAAIKRYFCFLVFWETSQISSAQNNGNSVFIKDTKLADIPVPFRF